MWCSVTIARTVGSSNTCRRRIPASQPVSCTPPQSGQGCGACSMTWSARSTWCRGGTRMTRLAPGGPPQRPGGRFGQPIRRRRPRLVPRVRLQLAFQLRDPGLQLRDLGRMSGHQPDQLLIGGPPGLRHAQNPPPGTRGPHHDTPGTPSDHGQTPNPHLNSYLVGNLIILEGAVPSHGTHV